MDQGASGSCGYVEGYYGKLLSWGDRHDLIQCLASLGLNTYCYAPKEDAHHRLRWREPYCKEWRQHFQQFCRSASASGVSIIAGIAPGLDFNFDNTPVGSTCDIDHLYGKALEFIRDGAADVLVLWDDIEAPSSDDHGGLTEGRAHARVVNQLGDQLGRALWTVPRVYAAEICEAEGKSKRTYLQDFFAELQPQHTVVVCGNAIVASQVVAVDLLHLSGGSFAGTPQNAGSHTNTDNLGNPCNSGHRIVLWDNFYANDYCPRRLFIGPWTGRDEIREYLLNPTGMPHTDQLLLDIASTTHGSVNRQSAWVEALSRHDVPAAFQVLAPFFCEPFFGDRAVHGDVNDIAPIIHSAEVADAIEECLWRWKSPLAREWYPFIMGLKHDLALMNRTLPRDRVLKTQPAGLANHLLSVSSD